MIYFDNAATTFPKPPAVIEAVTRALENFGNPSRGAHQASLAALRTVERTRIQVAELFGCPDPERVVFTKNVTEALNLALASVDGHIVSTEAEHNSVLRPLAAHGDFTLVEVDGQGGYEPEDVARAVTPRTRAVVLAHGSNLTGRMADLTEIGRLCRERELLFIVDAAQTAGLAPLDLEEMHIDALCFTGHKSLYGPQGTGGLCLSRRFEPRPLMYGGTGSRSFETVQPRDLPDRLESGTLNGHGLAGLSAGLAYLEEKKPAALWLEADRLARRFHRLAREIRGLTFYGDYERPVRAPIVTLNVGALDSAETAEALSERDIAVRAGIHCAPLLHRRFGTEKRGAVRFSFSHFNADAEIDAALEALAEIRRS